MRTQSLIVSLFLCLLTLLIFSTRASAQSTTWTFCANEGGTCSFSGTQQVRYGANGSYAYKTLSGGTACTNAVFGDPAYGVAKRCDYAAPTNWTFCASEGGYCAFSGTQQVRYGANGSYVYQTLTGGTACTNAVFGDPAYGIGKGCDYTDPTTSANWTFCANEGGTCSFSGTQQVRYGANGSYVYLTLTGGTACTNAVFGDPAYGAAKRCDYSAPTTTSTDWTFCAYEGGTCSFSGTLQVRYGANGSYVYLTLTGGTPCTNAVFGDPAYGAQKQCATGGTSTSSVAPSPSTPPTGYGPQAAITCPAGAVDIFPGQYIQGIVNLYAGATTFCLRAGVHSLTSAITPKTGNTFVGEYGAVLDGSNWSTSDGTQGAFRAHNQDIDYVTIRNLVIRNMPQQGIHAYYWMSDHWTIEYNEIGPNKWGIEFAPNFTIRNNYIHHNVGNSSSSIAAERGGGYLGNLADNATFDSNEIAYNGREQKVGRSANVTFRNNFVHHNVGDGIWYDSNASAGAVIDANRVEDNGRNGIFFEASIGATISNNTIRRNPWDAVMISMSQNAQIYNNTLEGNFGGIEYFLNCDVLSGGDDVKNNAAHDNTVVVGTQSYTYASGLSYTSSCTSTQLAPYLNGSKNLTFSRDTYRVPSLSWDQYFLWGGWKGWVEWQVMGQDPGGSLTQ
jgi:parallel beta-helix repeat protein